MWFSLLDMMMSFNGTGKLGGVHLALIICRLPQGFRRYAWLGPTRSSAPELPQNACFSDQNIVWLHFSCRWWHDKINVCKDILHNLIDQRAKLSKSGGQSPPCS